MRVRRATYDEAKGCREFDVFVGDRRIDNWRGELLVCVDDGGGTSGGEVLGFVSYSSNLFYNRPFIGTLCVRESARRRGAASALVERELQIYDGLDVWTSTEAENEPALRLFEKLGFNAHGRIDGLDGRGSVEMFFVHKAASA